MFLLLAHTKLNVYICSKDLVLECYKITSKFPGEERFAMVQQILRAAMSVILNLAEGCSRKSDAERNRFFEIARGSLIEVDTAIGIAHELSYTTSEELETLGNLIITAFKLLSGMITQNRTHN